MPVYNPTGSGGGAPSGAAGGDLTGTYPNPTFAVDMATQAELNAVAATIIAPVRATILGSETPIARVGSAPTYPQSSAVFYAFDLTSAGAQNDELHYDVHLGSGTWTMTMMHRKSTNVAVYTFNFDSDASFGTIDGYAAAPANSRDEITGITVATTGVKRLKLKALTRNASNSTGYFMIWNVIHFVRTGA